MDTNALVHGLLMFLALVAFVALHEFAHAWMANFLGDETPRLQGRLTLDPTVHAHPIGTLILPLVLVISSATGGPSLLCGWGRPVEVNIARLRHRGRDMALIALAGPVMNLLVAILLLVVMKIIELTTGKEHLDAILNLAGFSLFLCFFNLLPVPPLDGGYIMKYLLGISEEGYRMISQYSFMIFILLLRVPAIGDFISQMTNSTLAILAKPFGWDVTFSPM